MIIAAVCSCEDNHNSQHNTSIALIGFILKKLNISDNTADCITYTKQGKPLVENVVFSLSHSKTAVCCAVSVSLTDFQNFFTECCDASDFDNLSFYLVSDKTSNCLGVDIESVTDKSKNKCKRIAAKKFFPFEQQELNSFSTETDYEGCFCKIWTAKESYGKYTGLGLVSALSFDTQKLSNVRIISRIIYVGEIPYYLSVCFDK